jgi:chromosome segregation ATPase
MFPPETPVTPGTHRGSITGGASINDLLSHATIPAGPSVQLVERLSLTVRRLESERASSKDELTRITAQRDEARQEVVELMREVEAKRAGDERIAKLEEEVRELDARYQASLEMLGEKSELVEELKADVQDLKAMYRELVESTTK